MRKFKKVLLYLIIAANTIFTFYRVVVLIVAPFTWVNVWWLLSSLIFGAMLVLALPASDYRKEWAKEIVRSAGGNVKGSYVYFPGNVPITEEISKAMDHLFTEHGYRLKNI